MSDPKTGAERSAEHRRRNGIKPRVLKPHGTVAAARRHERNGERPCRACAQALRDYQTDRRMTSKGNR